MTTMESNSFRVFSYKMKRTSKRPKFMLGLADMMMLKKFTGRLTEKI